MRLTRITVGCRCCDKPVGVWLNTERYASVADQFPGLVPVCDPCGKLITESFITPGRLRRLLQRFGRTTTEAVTA